MTLPAIKRSTANRLAKAIRDDPKIHQLTKSVMADFLATFFKKEDHFFRDDIFYQVATGQLYSDPAIKNVTGKNQWSKENEV